MNNPIEYKDLFGDSVSSGLTSLAQSIKQVETEILGMMGNIKQAASEAGAAMANATSGSKGGRDAISSEAANVDKLYTAFTRLADVLGKVEENHKRVQRASESKATIDLTKAYESLADLIQETDVNLEALELSEKAQIQAAKNAENAAKSLAGSYNQLYAQYNLCKIALNAMSKEMRENANIGGKWESQAMSLMNTMKSMQEATGKHTLSVGDYGKASEATVKALNGLTISTQQVLREMPTLANSLQQFFIAISNNVPIFVDNLKRVQKETGSWVTAMKGVMTALISWQTALLVVLTVLPKIAKAIHDKRKAQEESNKAMKDAISLENLDAEALRNAFEATTNAINKLKVLYAISQDNNRAMKDRIAAAQVLKQEFKDELANYSEENIVMGEANDAMKLLVVTLTKQAQARAYLSEIGKLTIKQYDLEKKAVVALDKVEEAAEKKRNVRNLGLVGTIKYRKAVQELEAANAEYNDILDQQADVLTEIQDLQDRIDPTALFEEMSGGAKKHLDKTKDYYWEWRESIARILEDELERELSLNNIAYEHKIDTLSKELQALKDEGKLEIQQQEYLNDIMANLEIERQQRRQDIIWDYYTKTWDKIKQDYAEVVTEELVDELDESVSGIYNRLLIAPLATELVKGREKIDDLLLNGTYRELKKEAAAYKKNVLQKLEAEKWSQEALVKMRHEDGLISEEEMAIQIADIQTKYAKAVRKASKKNKGKFSIWNVLFGEKQVDEYGNASKQLTAEQESFVKSFESAMSTALNYMNEWIDKRIEMADVAVQAAQRETEAAKTAMDYEMQARANGYANNVALARKEYEAKLAIEKKAMEEKKRLEKIQRAIDTATQFSSLVTATAELWAAHGSIPIAGPALAAAATAAMWASFAASKIAAAKATQYGDGMSEYINYGGSHASGNDVDFGTDNHGRRRRVERGEVIGVINKRNVDKYGVSKVRNIIESLNNGTFDADFGGSTTLLETIASDALADKYSLAFSGMAQADLSKVEKGIAELISQGETRIVPTLNGRIEYRGNNKRIIRN